MSTAHATASRGRRQDAHRLTAIPGGEPAAIAAFRKHVDAFRPDMAGRVDRLVHDLYREPVSRQDRIRQRKKPLIAIRQHELVRLLDACVPLAPGPTAVLSAARLRAVIVVLDRTGIRVNELLALTETDLDADDRTILIRRGKGGKRRLVGMDDWGRREVQQWTALRNAHIPAGRLFPTVRGRTRGGPFTDADLRHQLAACAKRAGLPHNAHPHSFRHGWAVRARRDGMDLVTIQAQLGHSDLTTTAIYLDEIDPVERLAPVIHRPAPLIEIPHSTFTLTTTANQIT